VGHVRFLFALCQGRNFGDYCATLSVGVHHADGVGGGILPSIQNRKATISGKTHGQTGGVVNPPPYVMFTIESWRGPSQTLRPMKGRKCIRLPAPCYLGCERYFLTACTHDRMRFFASAALADYTVVALQSAAAHEAFLLHAWCAMPDHMHVLMEGANENSRACQFVNHWKCATRDRFRKRNRLELWQRSFFDRILRRYDAIYPIAWYIWLNPVRKGLCRVPCDYPWSGSLTMDWKAMVQPCEDWVPSW
jgi:putative transposase